MKSALRLLALFAGLSLGVTGLRAQASLSAGTPVFTPADSARTYMDVGAVWNGTARVDIGGSPTGDELAITYTNSGAGVAFDFAPRIVLPTGFTRVGVASVSVTTGTTPTVTPGGTTGTVNLALGRVGSDTLGAYDLPAGASITLRVRIRAESTVTAGTYPFSHDYAFATANGAGVGTYTATNQNILVRAGAYVTTVAPATLTLAVNASGVFTYRVTNTGLGGLFNVVFDEAASNPGASWDFTSFDSVAVTNTSGKSSAAVVNNITARVTIAYIAPGDSVSLPVTGVVLNCANIQNDFATSHLAETTPVAQFSPVILDLAQPLIDYTAPSIALAYGTDVTVNMPINNTGLGDALGLAANGNNFVIGTNLNAYAVTVSSVSTGWGYNPTNGRFTYSGTGGTIASGATVPLSFNIKASDDCGAGPSGVLVFSPQYRNRCNVLYSTPTKVGSLAAAGDAPSLTLTKSGSASRIDVAGTGSWTLSLSATQLAKITTDPVVVTDTLPAGVSGLSFVNNGSTGSTFSVAGNVVTWSVPKANLSSARTFVINFTAPTDPCTGGTSLTNTATASVTSTAACVLNTSATDRILFNNSNNTGTVFQTFNVTAPASPADGTFETGANTADLTRDNGEGEFITFTADYTIGAGYPGTWAGTTYADNFGGVTQLNLVPGSVEISLNNGGYTSVPGGSVTGGTGNLGIDLTFLEGAGYFNTPGFSSGATRIVSIRYRATAPDAAITSGSTRIVTQIATLTVAGGTVTCTGNSVFNTGDFYTLARATAALGVSMPSQISVCETFPVTLTVDNANAEHISNVLTTFFSSTGQYAFVFPQTPTYGGVYNGGNITFTPNAGIDPTFLYTGGDQTGSGTLTFNVRRKGTVAAATTTDPVSARVDYDDNQTNPSAGTREFTASGTASPFLVRKAVLTVIASPQQVFILGSVATWDIFVTNGGDGSATVVELLNTFPAGITPDATATRTDPKNSALGLTVSDVGIAGQQMTIQLGTLTAGQSKRITIVGNLDGSGCAFISAANSIVARWGCETGGIYVQTETANNPSFSQPVPQMQIVHDTVNTRSNLCATSTIEIVVRNVGLSATQDVRISEALNSASTGLTFTPGSVQYSLNNGSFNAASAAFNPTGSGTTADPYIWTDAQIPELARMDSTLLGSPSTQPHTVRIRFGVVTGETTNSISPQITAGLTFFKAFCGAGYSSPGAPYLVPVSKPNITVVKTGINRTVTPGALGVGSFGTTVFASTTDVVEWRIQITNSGGEPARNVLLTDTLAGTVGTTVLRDAAGGVLVGSYTSGTATAIVDIPASTTVNYYFTETLGATCVNALNTATVTWGCDATPPHLASPTTNTATARLNTVPDFGNVAGSITQVVKTTYDGTDFVDNGRVKHTVTLTNGGGTARAVAFTLTVPASMDIDPSFAATLTGTGGYTGVNVTGAHPTYTFTLTDAGAGRLRNGQTAVINQYFIQRTNFDTTVNPAAPTMAQICAYSTPETTGNGLDPALPASGNTDVALALSYQSTCGNALSAPTGTLSLNPRTPDLDLTVTPNPIQISASQAPYTFQFDFRVVNNGDSGSTANRIRFSLPNVGADWASVSATLVSSTGAGATIGGTTAAAPYDTLNLGRLDQGQVAVVRVSATTVAYNVVGPRPGAANLVLVGEVEGSLHNQAGTDTTNNYSLDRAAPCVADGFQLSGFYYIDANRGGNRDATEVGLGSGTYFVKAVPLAGGNAIAFAAINNTTGAYTLTGIQQDQYLLIVDDNNTLADTAPMAQPAGFIGIEFPGLSRPYSVGVTSASDLNFGVFRGSRLTGTVFRDNASPSGTANDGVKQAGEPGIAGVAVIATNGSTTTLDATTTAGDGSYTLWIPFTATTVHILETNPANFLSTGGQAGTTGGTYTLGADRVAFTATAGTAYTGVDFGDVPPPTFDTDGVQTILPGATASYPHTFTAQTGGKVTFGTVAATPGPAPGLPGAIAAWSHVVYRDTNGNGEADPGEPILAATDEITVVTGEVVKIVIKQFAPTGAPAGAQNRVTTTATFTALNGATPVGSPVALTRADLTTTGAGSTAGLDLVKMQVLDANCDAAETTGFSLDQITAGAVPTACVKYRLTFTNNGSAPLSTVIIYDTTPAFTTFVSATADPAPLNLAAPAILAPAANGTGAIRWTFTGTLAPGASGNVYFTVRVNN